MFREMQDSERDLVVNSASVAFKSLDLVEETKIVTEAHNHPNTKNKTK
jgi:Reverse transcriptase (RNA-dependent DNA polymerase)